MPNCLSRLVEPRNSVFEHSLALQKCRAFFFFANKSILKISMLYVFLFAGLFAKTSTLIHSLSRMILNFAFIFCVLYFVFSFLPIFVPTKKGNYEKFSNQSRISK